MVITGTDETWSGGCIVGIIEGLENIGGPVIREKCRRGAAAIYPC